MTRYTKSGYPYLHHVSNNGPKPKAGDVVFFHVEQSASSGFHVDSRRSQVMPRMIIPEDSLIDLESKAMIEGLMLMSEGDSLSVDFNLNQLPAKPVGFENIDLISFHIVLHEILSEQEYQIRIQEEQEKYVQEVEAKRARAGEVEQLLKELAPGIASGIGSQYEIVDLPKGMRYILLEEGTGKKVERGVRVYADYCGVLEHGEIFDSSFPDGRPYTFLYGNGEVVRGWDEAFGNFRKGSKFVLYVPYQMAYGVAGSPPLIPESANLIFYVEIGDVR